ncbi:IS5/IS1182 family transposase, partial [Nostoc punctiforme UO1]
LDPRRSRVKVFSGKGFRLIQQALNIFRILSSRYRNRRKRFGLRFNLIAGIYNYELSLKTN